MEDEVLVEDVLTTEQILEQLPTEEILEMQESLTGLQESLTGLQELQTQVIELQSEVTGIDQFITDNGELVINTLNLFNWFGYVGVPLIVIVVLFWTVYKQFLYTNI